MTIHNQKRTVLKTVPLFVVIFPKKSTSHIMKILREEFVNLHFVPLTY